jgi:hypothetical protein
LVIEGTLGLLLAVAVMPLVLMVPPVKRGTRQMVLRGKEIAFDILANTKTSIETGASSMLTGVQAQTR